MKRTYAIEPSNKIGLDSDEQWRIRCDGIVVFRIVRHGVDYVMMTATADEDEGQIFAEQNQKLLIEIAQKTANVLGVVSELCLDTKGREYVKICRIQNDQAARYVADVFFDLVQEYNQANDPEAGAAQQELREIYEAVVPDDSGADAYLGDGVWISSDGRLKDHGR